MIPAIDNLLKDYTRFSSEFQTKEFILEESSGGTAYGYYKQCLRELDSRKSVVQSTVVLLMRLELDIRELKPRTMQRDLYGNLLDPGVILDLFEKEVAYKSGLKVLEEQWEELHRFYANAKAVRALLPEVLDKETKDRLEIEFWASSTFRRMQADKLSTGVPSEATLKLFGHLPHSFQKEIMEKIQSDVEYCTRFTPPSTEVEIPPLPGMLELFGELRCSDLQIPQTL